MPDVTTDAETTETVQEPARPVLRILTPGATDEQVAALVAVFTALGSGEPAAPKPVAEWSAPHHRVRRTVWPTRMTTLAGTRGGWRSSGLPR